MISDKVREVMESHGTLFIVWKNLGLKGQARENLGNL